MGSLNKKIEKIIRLTKQSFDMFYYNSLAKKYKDDPKYKDLWLISERGTEAKDNGYCFFEYLCEKHPEINARFVIDKELAGESYKKVEKYEDRLIPFDSKEHKIAFLLSKYAISTHTGFLEPWSYRLYKLLLDKKDEKIFIFLQHGVILHDLSEFLAKHKIRADRFITTTKREYDFISSDLYGYDEGEVVQTGIARYDKLNDFKTKEQILIMPTWRKDIVTPSYEKKNTKDNKKFMESEYFKRFNSLINNKRLDTCLRENNLELIFYPHYEIQPYIDCFEKKAEKLVIANKDDYDVQELLKESKALITDFSSIQFDFAYMRKPLMYYQFDSIDDHYKVGYFDYERDGFGPVYSEEEALVDYIIDRIENKFSLEEKYQKRIDADFNLRDDKNCERIYEEILRVKK